MLPFWVRVNCKSELRLGEKGDSRGERSLCRHEADKLGLPVCEEAEMAAARPWIQTAINGSEGKRNARQVRVTARVGRYVVSRFGHIWPSVLWHKRCFVHHCPSCPVSQCLGH